jgi:RNase P protein component
MFYFLLLVIVLKHSLRLRSKEVRYLTKKRQYFVKGLFGFFYTKQYANVPHHQFSFHVTIKLSKHATQRNTIKRSVMNDLRDKNVTSLAIGNQFYKIFIVLNKNALVPLQQLLQEKKKAELHSYLLQAFQSSFTSFQSFLCSRT